MSIRNHDLSQSSPTANLARDESYLPRTCAIVITFLTLSLLAAPKNSAPLTVRVNASSGAPRLLVNGRPVRPRMFFGGPGSAPIRIQPAGRLIEFEFVAQDDAPANGTLHFRFGHTAGDVFLDNIRIVDVTSGKDVSPLSDFESGQDSFSRQWTFWPPSPANTVGTITVEPSVGAAGTSGLHVKLRDTSRRPVARLPHLPLAQTGHHPRPTLPRHLLGTV